MPNELTLEEQLKQGLIAPGTPFPIKQAVEFSFADDTISALQESAKQFKLTESAGGSNEPRKLMVTVEGIHTGMTKNRTFYPGTTLESSVPTWTTPHEKPVLKNHNEYTEPLGRIVHSEYVESTLTDKYTVRLKLEITDEDAIQKVLDKRYLTLSVGGSANRVNCSACGKDLVKEGYCGHSRGRTYEGKEAYWTIGEYTGDEISFVNMPADVHAQVIAAELVNGEGGKNVKDGKTKEGAEKTGTDTGIQTQESATGTDPTDLIDGLLGGQEPAKQAENTDTNPEDPSKQAEDNNKDNPETDGDDNKDNPANPEESNTESDADKLVRLQAELDEANGKIATMESEHTTALEEKEAEITTLTADLSEAKDKAETIQKHLESAEAEKETLTNQNVTLARFARKAMAERVADLRIMQGKDKFEDRDALITEWSQSGTKVLESQINDLLESGKRHVEKIQNPGLAIHDKNSVIEDDEGNEIEAPGKKKKHTEAKELPTMKTFESKMKQSMFRTV